MTSPRILVVDDEADLRELLEITLTKMGLEVDLAESLSAARAHLANREYALVLTDMRLPDGLGIELVRQVVVQNKTTPIAVITAFGSTDNAVAALKAGAFDYLSKPVGLDQLRLLVRSALNTSQAAAAPGREENMPSAKTSRLVGESQGMREVRSQIMRLARSMAPVAIIGESGCGKELVARDIHAHSVRAGKPFVAVNCGAIPEALMEAEFFGYRKGAFTGAAEDRDGFFQAANGGTLLLDEIADLPLAMQVKLLRAIQERRVRKVGATVEEPVDVRLISATHQDLAKCVEKGQFRQDLYYRLNVIEMRLPPLRERSEDIGMLAELILARVGGQGKVLSKEALDLLRTYPFPGNVRELENILERALAFAEGGVIQPGDLGLRSTDDMRPTVRAAPPASTPAPAAEPAVAVASRARAAAPGAAEEKSVPAEDTLPRSLPEYLDQVEREIIERALAQTRYNRTQAAELLGISFRQLRYRMQRLLIQEPER